MGGLLGGGTEPGNADGKVFGSFVEEKAQAEWSSKVCFSLRWMVAFIAEDFGSPPKNS